MNKRYVIGVIIIIVFIVVGFFAFVDTKVEYANFQHATETHKKYQVKGTWVKDKEAKFDAATNKFTFYMKDENNIEMKVVLDGAEPNNFSMAESVVAKGKIKDGNFYATEVLTKCPSKYEGDGKDVKKSSM